MKKNILTITLLLGMACSGMAQSRVYTLAEWQNVDANKELAFNVSEYKLDFNHPLPYADMQRSWTVKAELKCGTLGTEQVFVCKEGKASHLIGRNSLNGDISLGYDNMHGQFFVEVIDKDENPHRLCAGPKVEAGRWYEVSAKAQYNANKDQSVLELTVDGQKEQLSYPGKALRHNASLWVIGHGFPGGFPNALQVRDGAIRNLEISGEPLPRVDGQNPLFTDHFTADPAFTVVGNTVYAYVGEDQATPGGWFNMPHWLCYSSTDMKHWTAHGPVLKSDDFPYATAGGACAASMVAKDIATLDKLHADDFVLTHMTGMRQSKAVYLEAIRNGTLNYYNAKMEQLDIRVDGDSAVMTSRSRVLAAVFGGGKHTWPLQLRFTLRKDADRWQLTSASASTY